MVHFTKGVETFSRFSLKLRAANPKIKDLKSIGVDMEATILNGFKIPNPVLGLLISVRHLRKRNKEKALKLLEKTNQTAAQRSKSKKKILSNIYGECEGTYFDYDLAEASNECDFNVKL